jgi:CRP-like cAMP-binding protein
VTRRRTTEPQPSLSLAELLQRSVWYPGLPAPMQQVVAQRMQERPVAAGAVLLLHGGTATHWHGVLEGVLKWSATTPDGRSVTLGGLTAGSWFGEGSLLHGRPVQADVVALRDSRVALLPKDVFDGLVQHSPAFNHFLLRQLNERLHWFMGDFAAHRLYTAETLVARALLGLVHPFLHPGASKRLEISQEEIAHLAGLSRQRCNQALKSLAEAGTVAVAYGGVCLTDTAALCRIAGVEPY